MFTVKQETDNGDKIWPNVTHVYTSPKMQRGEIDAVYGLLASGGDLQFHASENHHTIYVMNDSGSTVARYDLGLRTGHLPAGQSLAGPCAADPAKLVA